MDDPKAPQEIPHQPSKKVAWRKNVLYLFTAGYIAILAIFAGMILGGATPAEAFEAIKTALTGVTSGALAISKDLI